MGNIPGGGGGGGVKNCGFCGWEGPGAMHKIYIFPILVTMHACSWPRYSGSVPCMCTCMIILYYAARFACMDREFKIKGNACSYIVS